MKDRSFRIVAHPTRFAATDVVVLAALVGFAALAAVFRAEVPSWRRVVAANLVVAALYVAANVLARRRSPGVGRFVLRTGAVTGALGYLFGAVAPLQLVLHGRFLDAELMAFEERILSQQPVLWLERFVSPVLTEWLMFCYVAYVALYPLVCGALWFRRGERAAESCFLGLAVVNVACDIGFLLFPVAGPAFFMPGRFTVALTGGPFTALGEFVRTELHFPGGSLPSPHCAAATVLWVMAWRHERRLAWVLAPMVLSLYVATVYGRFHYLSDAVTGVATALAAVALTARRAGAEPG